MAEPTPALTPATPPGPGPDVRLLRSITLRNILSFGPDTPPLELRALNVLIGPNGSGKSNLLDAVELLKKAPDAENLRGALGAEHWMHKGKPVADSIKVRVEINHTEYFDAPDDYIGHELLLTDEIGREWMIWEQIITHEEHAKEPHRVDYDSNSSRIWVKITGQTDYIQEEDFDRNASCLFQFRDPRNYRTLTILSNNYRKIRLYREWTFGRNSGPRLPRRTDERNDFLAEDGSNLGLVLNKLRTYPEVKDQFISALNELYEGIKDFDVLVEGGSAQIFLREGNTSIPATRLSDGTLRYLCLLAILLHPTPPPLICLEEPELGLHPDAVVAVGKLIKEASTRTQLIITTHSSMLLDVLSESPEDVVVCSKRDGATHMQRLDAEKLAAWLKDYSLGELWNSGQIGGNRW